MILYVYKYVYVYTVNINKFSDSAFFKQIQIYNGKTSV